MTLLLINASQKKVTANLDVFSFLFRHSRNCYFQKEVESEEKEQFSREDKILKKVDGVKIDFILSFWGLFN